MCKCLQCKCWQFFKAPNGNLSSTRLLAFLCFLAYCALTIALFYMVHSGVEGWEKLVQLSFPLAAGFAPLSVAKINPEFKPEKE